MMGQGNLTKGDCEMKRLSIVKGDIVKAKTRRKMGRGGSSGKLLSELSGIGEGVWCQEHRIPFHQHGSISIPD